MNISELDFKYVMSEPSELIPELDDVCHAANAGHGVWLANLQMARDLWAESLEDNPISRVSGLAKYSDRWAICEGFSLRDNKNKNIAEVVIAIHDRGHWLNSESWLNTMLAELPVEVAA